ncbi:hypothetical protein U6G28_05705 [Actinomycetaceae bacterium MB13-C1-2]|nr:hypothetical protein U6G28_05705 [Actinomycetaceae bacterium MB13-C1-2]
MTSDGGGLSMFNRDGLSCRFAGRMTEPCLPQVTVYSDGDFEF